METKKRKKCHKQNVIGRYLSKVNWGELYDSYGACLVGKPTYFCGSRPEPKYTYLCHKCLNDCVEGMSNKNKVRIFAWLWYNYNVILRSEMLIRNVKRFLKSKYRGEGLPF